MQLGLHGARALVTAASQGLGLACAGSLAREGARVVVSSRDEARAAAAAKGVGAVTGLGCDLRHGDQIAGLVDRTVGLLGGLDILVVNSGPPPAGSFEESDELAWEEAETGVLRASVRLLRAALPALRGSGRGRVVVLTGYGVREPTSDLVLSESTRAAVTVIAKVLATDAAGDGVTVNTIAPGPVLTDRLRELQARAARAAGREPEEQLARFAATIPVGRVGEPAEIGDLCAFLCSAQAGYLTGQTIVVDGGINRAV
jgi:3-oxoacyl-[acyl-carrier protein] reductase